ncbi:MAG: hypothetical protein HKN82_14545 [Akkermansiaceae bacterium]|nr:hypothetical protein [Akkermansiaceae bacterium]NNM29607.1 hypothetical protein [Akkermansiaceae bacterium]
MQDRYLMVALAAALALVGCKPQATVVEISETRELTTEDTPPRLKATSAERFQGSRAAGPAGYRYETPEGWTPQPASMLRSLNFAIGPEGEGEVYLSRTRGDVGSNVNRWRKQFGMEPLSPGELAKLPRTVGLGGELALVDAAGTYAPGMGRPPQEGFALVGVIGQSPDEVVTVKMVGPEAVVQAERERFLQFVRSLQPAE